MAFFSQTHFHPTFLYESIGSLTIFAVLISFIIYIIKNHKTEIYKIPSYELCVASYAIMYSLLRFSLEFIRIDPTPFFWGLKLPQWVSLIIIIIAASWLLLKSAKHDKNKIVLEQN
jgi:phosphatidylglycerol:prolipoprotein diacylglycerol transferase